MFRQFKEKNKNWLRLKLKSVLLLLYESVVSLSVTCGRSWLSPITSTNKTEGHDNNWNIVKSGAKHHNPNPPAVSDTSSLSVSHVPSTVVKLSCLLKIKYV